MKDIDLSKVRVGSIIKYHGNYWVAIGRNDFELADILAGDIIFLHNWYWRKSGLPCPPKVEKKDPMNWTPFYTCFVEGTDGGQHIHHHNLGTAKIEAERLSGQPQNIGKKVYVMKAVSYCKSIKPEVEWND